VSPADGRILSFGLVNDEKVEQIKGNHYTLSALLGSGNTNSSELPIVNIVKTTHIVDEKEFANINGITYSLDSLLGDDPDMSIKQESTLENDVSGLNKADQQKKEKLISKNVTDISLNNTHKWHAIKKGNGLFFCVIYLAPGDYHRFHSPTNWVVESRRHFADTPVGTYAEMSYKNASKLLGGQPLRIGEEIGGFCLGSTIVLIFEAPLSFKFCATPEQKIQ
ncbi:18203_t:CDS:2, partial [Racocetra fulgida]